MKSNNILYNVDDEKVKKLLEDTDENSQYFTSITNNVIDSYVGDLDLIMNNLYDIINNNQNLTNDSIENYMLRLSNTLYYLGDRLEIVGIKADVAKAAKQEVYNRAYLDNQIKDSEKKNKTTVAENQAVAEENSKYESIITSIFERVYKVIRFKIDAGQEMLKTLSKILTKRLQEFDLTKMSPIKTGMEG